MEAEVLAISTESDVAVRRVADAAGQVIGINTAVAASSGGVQASNIGFAISTARVLAITDELI